MINKASLLDVAKQLSADASIEARQFEDYFNFLLKNRIAIRKLIAGEGSEVFDFNVSLKAMTNVTGMKYSIILLLKSLLFVIKPAAKGGILPAIATEVVGPNGAIVSGTGIAWILNKRAKNRMIGKARIYYKDYFPDNSTIKLFSWLITLTIVSKLPIVASGKKVTNKRFRSLRKNMSRAKRAILNELREPNENKVKIAKFAEQEFLKIWDVFKNFTRQPEAYHVFKATKLAERVSHLIDSQCDLGDPNDRSQLLSHWERNLFWVNLFACYLAAQGQEVCESILTILESKLNVIPKKIGMNVLNWKNTSSLGVSMSSSVEENSYVCEPKTFSY